MKYKIRLILLMWLVILILMYVQTGTAKLVFCDVGQGDAVLIRDGTTEMLLDSGSENNKLTECLGRYMPFWDKTIETVIISHWDSDHSGGLKNIAKYYKLDSIMSSERPSEGFEQFNYSKTLRENDIVRLGNIEYEVASPEQTSADSNENSLVGLLSYEDIHVLMMGDADFNVEERLVWRGVLKDILRGRQINILKAGHHGSATSTSKLLLQTVQPEETVISVGKNNRFGHPSSDTLKRIEDEGSVIRRTDRDGDIVIELLHGRN
ncbi:MAG TPA: MBL fold metallo-hydrolase [Patescibacteria group bacterium]